jgi:hypothetical protein
VSARQVGIVEEYKMDVNNVLERLRRYCESQNFAGWDPYDAMNSPFMPVLSLGTKYGRIAWTQFLRRSPVNLRPLLMIPKGYNPKGLGLFLRSYSRLYAMDQKPEYLDVCRKLIHLLKECRSEGYSGNCWGYNFRWQSRVTDAPKYTPTVVNSSFIGHALMDCYELTGDREALELASSIPDFIINDLNRLEEGAAFCFSYMPTDYDYVHNANALGASLVVRVAKAVGLDRQVIEQARRSMAYTMNHQHEDGSWYFAEEKIQHWIDSYHTGFVLEALRHVIELGEGDEWREHYRKGVEFYANNFFLPDGTCTYYHDRGLPIDIHCPSEAVIFFSHEPGHADLAEKTCRRMIETLWDEKRGYFWFRLTRGKIPNRIPYIRWGQAWALLALVEYEYAKHLAKE